jgi:hypothetical protein
MKPPPGACAKAGAEMTVAPSAMLIRIFVMSHEILWLARVCGPASLSRSQLVDRL